MKIIEQDEDTSLIMVVDDCETNGILLENFIKRVYPNAIILTSKNGEDAINQFKACVETGYKIEAIFMDLMMPGLQGDEALRKMCEYTRAKHNSTLHEMVKHIAIVTAHHGYKGGECDHCNECGNQCCETIIYKPVRLKSFTEFLRN